MSFSGFAAAGCVCGTAEWRPVSGLSSWGTQENAERHFNATSHVPGLLMSLLRSTLVCQKLASGTGTKGEINDARRYLVKSIHTLQNVGKHDAPRRWQKRLVKLPVRGHLVKVKALWALWPFCAHTQHRIRISYASLVYAGQTCFHGITSKRSL